MKFLNKIDGTVLNSDDASKLGGKASAAYILATQKAAANGVATLDAASKIPATQLPSLAITSTFIVSSQVAMLGLTAEVGDFAIRTDLSRSFILRVAGASVLANWQEIISPTAGIVVSATAPATPSAGTEWFCTTDGRSYIWFNDGDSSQWVEASPQSALITDTPTWLAPTLQNSWAQQTNYSVIGYYKDSNGWVHLRGGLLSGVAPNVMFTLPTGYRPPKIMVFASASASGACRITINPDGTVVPTAVVSNNPGIDGISFYVG